MRYAASGGDDDIFGLDELLWRRHCELDAKSQQILRLLALAEAPIPTPVLATA